ncbi:MAG: hypothetical protein IT326_06850 [Anaerolineae bacterium]|nr:hypothetical protein [Anaerolineae bacterium]
MDALEQHPPVVRPLVKAARKGAIYTVRGLLIALLGSFVLATRVSRSTTSRLNDLI